MPSGFYPIGPAGFDEQGGPSAPPVTVPTVARKLFSNPLDYRSDPKGRLKAGNSVDQGIALSLAVRKGSIKSAPFVGNELRKVELGTPRTAADVRDAVMTAYPLSRYVENGDVQILSIDYEERTTGGLMVVTSYRNLTSDANSKAIFRENAS